MAIIADTDLTAYLKRVKAYADQTKPHHLKKQMKAWSKRRDQNTLQLVLGCPLGDVSDVWVELKDII